MVSVRATSRNKPANRITRNAGSTSASRSANISSKKAQANRYNKGRGQRTAAQHQDRLDPRKTGWTRDKWGRKIPWSDPNKAEFF